MTSYKEDEDKIELRVTVRLPSDFFPPRTTNRSLYIRQLKERSKKVIPTSNEVESKQPIFISPKLSSTEVDILQKFFGIYFNNKDILILNNEEQIIMKEYIEVVKKYKGVK
jgi:hypothetical protein